MQRLACLLVIAGLAPARALEQPAITFGSGIGLISYRNQNMPPLDDILQGPDPEWPVYGIYSWCGEYVTYHAGIAQMGWKNVRIGGPMTDAGMTLMVNDSVRVMYTLSGTKRDQFTNDTDFINSYKNDLTTFLNRYGPGGSFLTANPSLPQRPVRHVEIWNEPNFQYMIPDFDPRSECEAQRETLYSKLLPAAYEHIKASWPTVQVVGFGAGGAANADIRFIDHVHALDTAVASSYDVLSTHPYINPAHPEGQNGKGVQMSPNLASVRAILDSNRVTGRPIWYTEIGWPISKAEGGYYDMPATETTTQRLQAAYITRLYAYALRLGVPFVTNMFVSDTDNFNGGFFNRDRTWRESATAVKTMTTLMPHPRLIGAINDGNGYWYAYRFLADVNAAQPETVVMAWDLRSTRMVDLNVTAGTAVVTDMLGAAQNTTTDGQIEIGPCPVYIQGGTIPAGLADRGQDRLPAGAGHFSIQPLPIRDKFDFAITLKKQAAVSLAVYDSQGKLFGTLLKDTMPAGHHTVTWEPGIGSGIYFYNLNVEGQSMQGILTIAK